MQKTVFHNQSLIDFSLNHCGCLDSLLMVALANGLSITDDLVAGQVLTIPSDAIIDTTIRDYFYAKNVIPALWITARDLEIVTQVGIGQMRIGTTFTIG
ncbi:hypothetical protein [uncultured Mucilaginibacter sp.]|uniref:hypothetical protein n=1 Tax=uncultured Mucilaginibacter sp. TaxID=797541 RepID=UPI0025D24FF1|nr:hypothetical protein [uncultured Mucilaginibacter sp.]